MKDGGPAFPRVRTQLQVTNRDFRGIENGNQTGMSLRDWFAGGYDSSRVSFPDTETMAKYIGEEDIPSPADWLAILALARRAEAKLRYDYADAMLAEREKAEA